MARVRWAIPVRRRTADSVGTTVGVNLSGTSRAASEGCFDHDLSRRTLAVKETAARSGRGGVPHLTAMVSEITHDADTTFGWCDDQFEFALDPILDGLERARDAA
jgi:hypothetical protein